MTVLRSRKILPTVTPKPSQQLALENVVDEPATPSKTSEFLNRSSKITTASSSSPTQSCGHFEMGFGSGDSSIMVSECGIMRRHSARLAKKAGISDHLENVEVVSAKRKKVEGTSINDEFDVWNLGRRVYDVKLEVESSGGNPDPIIIRSNLQDMGDGGVTELVKVKERIKDGESVAKLECGYDVETFMVETMNNGKRKRRISMEVKALGSESRAEHEVEKGFLSLRSGKRVVKREMRDNSGCVGNMFEGIENSKKSGLVSSGDVLLESASEPNVEKDENGRWKERRLSREEKVKGTIVIETSIINGSASVNSELHDRIGLSVGDLNQDAVNLTKRANPGEVAKDKGGIVVGTGVKTRRRLSIEEKGKIKLEVKASSCSGSNTGEVKVENVNGNHVSGASHSGSNEALEDGVHVRNTDVNVDDTGSFYRERFRKIARRIASRFAHFSSQDELESHAHDAAGREIPLPESDSGIEDWPGPFSTAMKIIKDRESNRNGERLGASTDKIKGVKLKWIRKNQESCKHQKQVPSLQELCLAGLSKNADAITSLDFVPDVLRHKICWFLCNSRRMDDHFLKLLVNGTPTEIRVWDCSWLSEELFTRTFEGCDASKLMVLQFDQCGSCLPDYTLYAALAHSPNSLPALTMISLKGAYRLSDAGLHMLVSAAPSLKSIDISQCPLLTSEGICYLASSLRLVLKELYLDNCHGIDAMLIVPALQKLENLEVLSVAGIQTVCDDFVSEFASARGCRMKQLVLADCMELTDSSLEVIGDTCSDLQAIDVTNLCKLTDISIGHLANGCSTIQTLKFCRNAFGDEAIAAYLDVRGASLKDLALNNIVQVSNQTALSLARNCRNLRNLDLSWCRNLTNEALGLIADSCSSLEVLKLFGCTQVTDVFLDGHSNPQVKLIGLKMTPVIKDIDVPDFLLGPLRYSSTCP